MVKGGHPSVFVVDSYATRPPAQPRLSQGRRSATGAQSILFLLVSLALCGMAVEACLIYRLYQLESVSIYLPSVPVRALFSSSLSC